MRQRDLRVCLFGLLSVTTAFLTGLARPERSLGSLPARVSKEADNALLSVANEGVGSAVEGSAVTGDGVVGRSENGLAGRFEGRVRAQVLEITGGSDLVEPFEMAESEWLRPGAVVSIDPKYPGKLRVSRAAYDRTVAGVVSGANGIHAGISLAQDGVNAVSGSTPIALSGRVFCWADASSGAIRPGDLLTTSDRPGHAMKVREHHRATGAVIGKAMTPLPEGTGLVLLLVNLQ